MKYREIEFKYRADDITLKDFTEFCKARGESAFITASGYDYFYDHAKDHTCFARHRVGPAFNQLTFKRKTTDKNNFVRTEHNIDLAMSVRPEQTQALCAEFGYRYNTSIFKNVFLYQFNTHTLVYYVCYDEKLKELGRFIEIEMSEDYDWLSEDHAMGELLELERAAYPLGLSAQKRLRNSLFEMFKRG